MWELISVSICAFFGRLFQNLADDVYRQIKTTLTSEKRIFKGGNSVDGESR